MPRDKIPDPSLESSLFGSSQAPICKTLAPQSLAAGYPQLGEEFNTLLARFKSGIQNKRPEEWVPLFHARLKFTEAKFKLVFHQIYDKLKGPLEVSTYRVFALRDPQQGSPLIACDSDDVHIHPLVGHGLQFAVWIQLLGKEELGRIFIQIVMDQDQKWKIGSFYYTQWTHDAKNSQDWAQESIQDEKNAKLISYLKLDLASKLVKATPYFRFDEEQALLVLLNKKKITWEYELRKLLNGHNAQHLSSTLTSKGVGLSMKAVIPQGVTVSPKDECKKLWTILQNEKRLNGLKGLRCAWYYPDEKIDETGRLEAVTLP